MSQVKILGILELDAAPNLMTLSDAISDHTEHFGRGIPVYVDGLGDKKVVFEDIRVISRDGNLEAYLVLRQEMGVVAVPPKGDFTEAPQKSDQDWLDHLHLKWTLSRMSTPTLIKKMKDRGFTFEQITKYVDLFERMAYIPHPDND